MVDFGLCGILVLEKIMESNKSQIISQRFSLSGYVSSLIGGRPENQDDFGWTETSLGFLLVVCDGMGGGPGGKTASYIAKTKVMQTIQDAPPQADRKDLLKMAISTANDAMYEKMNQVPSLRGMGSTIVAVLINEQSAIVAHLGDSRVYRLHGRQVLFRTKDHSLVGELVQNKVISEEQARTSPQANVITRGLGNTSNHVAEIEEIPYRKGDRFVLCTDGVWGIMPHSQLVEWLGGLLDVPALVTNLQNEVDKIGNRDGGNHDNHTLAIIEMNMESIMKVKMSKQIKILLSTLSILLLISIIFNIVCLIKLGNAPQKKAYENVLAENATFKQELDVLRNFRNADDKEHFLQLTQLSAENKELAEENNELRQEIAEMEERITTLESAAANSQGHSRTPPSTSQTKETKEMVESPKSGKSASEALSSLELVEKILKQYDRIEKVKEKELSAVIKRVEDIRDEIAEDLDVLGKKCKNPQRTTHIKNQLPTNERISGSINKSGKNHIPNPYLLKEFRKSQKALEELQEALIQESSRES